MCPKSCLGHWGLFSGQRNPFLQETSTSWISPLRRWKKASNAGADACTKLLQNQYIEEPNVLGLYFSRASHSLQAPTATYIFLPALKFLFPLTCPEQLLGQAHFQSDGSILPQLRVGGLGYPYEEMAMETRALPVLHKAPFSLPTKAGGSFLRLYH